MSTMFRLFFFCLLIPTFSTVIHHYDFEESPVEPSLYHVPVRIGHSTVNLALDINSNRTWIFAEYGDRLLTYNSLHKQTYFQTTYTIDNDGFTAAFDGLEFEEKIGFQNQNDLVFDARKVGYVFRTTFENVGLFRDGVLGVAPKSINENCLLGDVFTIITDRNETQVLIRHGRIRSSEFAICGQITHENVSFHTQNSTEIQRGSWNIDVLSVQFGDYEFRHKSRPYSAVFSTLSPVIVGPSTVVGQIYEALNVTLIADKKPKVHCQTNGPEIVFQTSNGKLRVHPNQYIERKSYGCYLRLLPSKSQKSKWILGQPFHAARCLTFDDTNQRIGIANLL
ncbi:hypothetical protein M3Y96_00133000 [Aphelenchoides besseyi]|nr:hypothetical protein M3Y96_00133000 [Aphelenchoides besseyi]